MRAVTWPLVVLFALPALMAASCERQEEKPPAAQTAAKTSEHASQEETAAFSKKIGDKLAELDELLAMYEKLAPMVE